MARLLDCCDGDLPGAGADPQSSMSSLPDPLQSPLAASKTATGRLPVKSASSGAAGTRSRCRYPHEVSQRRTVHAYSEPTDV